MLRHVDLNNHHPPRLKGFIRELTLLSAEAEMKPFNRGG